MSEACIAFAATPRWRVVSPKQAADTPATLGDLLYADRSRAWPTEAEWVRLVTAMAAGDQQALRAIYARMHRVVFTLAMRICNDREIAEEVTLDVFHEVWRRAPGYDASNGSVVGWIMIQARSRAIDRLRFEQRKKRVDPLPGEPEPAETPGPNAGIAARQRRQILEEALRELTLDERTAIETAFFSGLTYAEAATKLAEPVGTVKTRVRSALAKLRKALAEDGGEP